MCGFGQTKETRSGEAAAGEVGDEAVGLAFAADGYGREEAEGFFDHDSGGGELVKEVWVGGNGRGELGEGRPEDGNVLGWHACEDGGMAGEKLEVEADGGGGGVVAGEKKEPGLRHAHLLEEGSMTVEWRMVGSPTRICYRHLGQDR